MSYQVVTDSLDINTHLQPDIVVLDEAQRIKNWATKTAQAVKRLKSRHAVVLTGTPIESRIDELYSIVDFLDPSLLGPLFRFNREFYIFNEKGRPEEYRNLAALRERVRPVLLRRRKHHVETELPDRTDRNHFVSLTNAMRLDYDEYKLRASRLLQQSIKRPLTKEESDRLMIYLGIMRMICDLPSIVKNLDCHDCPKLDELARILEEALGQSLIHCQEALLPGESKPVILTVLRDPTRAAAVSALFHETRWGDSAPTLHVLDQSTWSSLQQLIEAGLITLNTRATQTRSHA